MFPRCKLCGFRVQVVHMAFGDCISAFDIDASHDGTHNIITYSGGVSVAYLADAQPVRHCVDLPRFKQHLDTCPEWKKQQEKADD